MKRYGCVALIILDGWGHREDGDHNPIVSARTPFFDFLYENFPHSLLDASGEHVGLLPGVMGNSEVGHMTIGAGRVIETDLARIENAIIREHYRKIPAFGKLFEHVKANDSVLHVMGLLSPIGVHSHQEHLHEFLRLAKKEGIKKVAIHAFTDGRDCGTREGAMHMEHLEKLTSELRLGHVATVTGRYYAMDRDGNWNRTDKAKNALFKGEGTEHAGAKPSAVLRELYGMGEEDEHIEPRIFPNDAGDHVIRENDAIFFFNFRNDRARQLCYRIQEETEGKNIVLATMTEYAPDIRAHAAFPRLKISNTLAETVSRARKKQAHIAETEKYAHVTYFFNGERKELHAGEEHILIDSRKDVRTHNEAPEMRAREIADAAIASIRSGAEFLVINFANADMVGHTADHEATVRAVETIDRELKRIVEALEERDGAALITADHGNAEITYDAASGEKHTAHTSARVPVIVTVPGMRLRNGSLADVAPTVLALMGISKPGDMTGEPLF